MKNVVLKASRLEMPVNVSCRIRREVYDFLAHVSKEQKCAVSFLARGILEDAYDRWLAEQELRAVRATFPLDDELSQSDLDV